MAKKSEGAAVRHAMDGPTLDHDALIDQVQTRVAEQHARASDASESGAALSEFIEATGLNTDAYKVAERIYKLTKKKDGQIKAMDFIRSLKVVVPMMEAHVSGQPDMFDQAADDLEPVEPVTESDIANFVPDDFDDDAAPGPDDDSEVDEGDDIEEESDDFDAAAEALEESPTENVVKAFGA